LKLTIVKEYARLVKNMGPFNLENTYWTTRAEAVSILLKDEIIEKSMG